MTIYKNDPNYKVPFTSKKHTFLTVENTKIRKNNKNKKSHIFEILINLIQSAVNAVYDRRYRDNMYQFQCHTV